MSYQIYITLYYVQDITLLCMSYCFLSHICDYILGDNLNSAHDNVFPAIWLSAQVG